MLKLVVFFACLMAAQALASNECAKGPEYWCQSVDNAVECDSFKHCLDTVWNKHGRFLNRHLSLDAETANPNKCQNCVLCLQSNIQKCPMAQKHMSEVHQMVSSDMPRRTICELLNHCETAPMDSDEVSAKNFFDNIKIKFIDTPETVVETPLSKKPSLVETSGMGCELCNIIFTAAKYLMENKVEQKIIFGFIENQLCARLGDYNNTCVYLVEKEGAELLAMLAKSYSPAEVCAKIGLCSRRQIGTQERPVELLNLNVERSNMNCTLCKMTMIQIKQMFTNGKSQKEILDYFNNNLCARVGKSKDICTTFVNNYGPVLLELIAKDINPDQLCVMLGFCVKSSSLPVASVSLWKNVMVPPVKSDATCAICEFAMNLLVKYVNQNSSVPEVEKWLEYICNSEMPKPIRNECDAFVQTYGPVVISLLIKQVDPKKICTTIGLCPKTQAVLTSFDSNLIESSKPKEENMPVAKAPKPKKEITCSLCKLVMEYIDDRMQIDRTQQLIQLTVDNMCSIVPKRLRSECDSMVERYGSKLLDFINQHTNPELVCAHIKVCEAQQQEIDIVPSVNNNNKFVGAEESKINGVQENVSAKNGSLECSLCLYVAELVDALLKQNKTDQEIVAELKQVCNLFPSNIKDQCNAFINEYGAYVLQVLAADLDPQATCTLLKLCDSSIIGMRPRKTRYPY